jgi:hypothetical protein
MKTKTKTTTVTKTESIAVSAAFVKACSAVISKDKAAALAIGQAKSAEISLANATESEFDDKDVARKALQQVFAPYLEKGDIEKSYMDSRVSNVLAIAFPKAGIEIRDKAIAAFEKGELNIEQVKSASRGSLAPSKKAGKAGKIEWIAKKTGNRQGGSNKKSPLDAMKTALALATSGKDFAKSVDAEQFAVAIAEIVMELYPKTITLFTETIQKQLPNH